MHLLLALVVGLAPRAVPRDPVLQAASVLHAWDSRREAAWAAQDDAALQSLYVRGSTAGVSDRRLLHAYAARGLVVRRIVTQVFALEVLDARRGELRLRICERVAGGQVYDGHRTRQLGSTRPAVRFVRLQRAAGSWRVVSVTATAPRTAPPARPGR